MASVLSHSHSGTDCLATTVRSGQARFDTVYCAPRLSAAATVSTR